MLRVAMLSLASALLLLGCGQAATKAIEQSTGVRVEQKGDGETVTIRGKEGEQMVVGSGATVPDDLKNFPVPQGFTVQSNVGLTQGGKKVTMTTWESKSKFGGATEFYKKMMPTQGWQEELVMEMDGQSQLAYSMDETKASITVFAEDDTTTINVVVEKPEK